ncbi:MAG: hypothetical protein U0X20_02575 [Caldilineaceae bacterium]
MNISSARPSPFCIEPSKFRNRSSITNLNTLSYFMLNLRALVRMLDMQHCAAAP